MTPHFLGPYWVQLNYTVYSPHSMTIPIKGWNASGTVGTIDIWSGGTINALTMVTDLVVKLKALFNSDASFDNYIIYKQLTEDDLPTPVAAESFSGQVGTDTTGAWSKATERIFIARSNTFGLCKLDLLDLPASGGYEPVTSPGVGEAALITEWFDDAKGWMARDNGQPYTFLKYTTNLNQKLRKAYRMD